MRPFLSAAAMVIATILLTAALFSADVFARINKMADRAFGAVETQDVLYRDPRTQETSSGEHPLESFDVLSAYWAAHPAAHRVCLIGNSQMQTINLASGETPVETPEKTYPDLIGDYYHQHGRDDYLVYRLSAGGLSYAEALWYLEYLAVTPAIKPGTVFLQINYQAFNNAGIREGMLEMLNDPPFRAVVEAISADEGLVSAVFAESLARFKNQPARLHRSASAAASTLPTAIPQASGYGYAIETNVRAVLQRLPGFERRVDQRDAFIGALYRARVYVLRLTPSSARSIAGVRLGVNEECLRAIADLCAKRGMHLAFFYAPLNPRVSLYRVDSDRRTYHEFMSGLAAAYGVPLYDFEGSVPSEHWGTVLNTPEPLHLGRAGHQILASLLISPIADMQSN